MRATSRGFVAAAFALAVVYAATAAAGGASVVIRPSDIIRADAKGSVVEVVVGEPKAAELSSRRKQTPIELSIPNSAAAGIFNCETRYGRNSATITFKFGDHISASAFADELKAAVVKSQCDCH